MRPLQELDLASFESRAPSTPLSPKSAVLHPSTPLRYQKHWLVPLRAAFSNLTRETDLVVCEGPYCGAHFYLWGHLAEELGIRAYNFCVQEFEP